jgi:hypothetical protein
MASSRNQKQSLALVQVLPTTLKKTLRPSPAQDPAHRSDSPGAAVSPAQGTIAVCTSFCIVLLPVW